MNGLWDRLVAEPEDGGLDADYRWVEVSLDRPAAAVAREADKLRRAGGGERLIGASRTKSWARTLERVSAGVDAGLDAVLFEAGDHAEARALVAELRLQRRLAIPTVHLDDPCDDPARLVGELERLHSHSGYCAKVAYPARTPAAIAAGLTAIARCAERGVTVSLTPMGTAWGRLAAALAGSALVFAPVRSDDETRPSARRMLQLDRELGC